MAWSGGAVRFVCRNRAVFVDQVLKGCEIRGVLLHDGEAASAQLSLTRDLQARLCVLQLPGLRV